jgi:hypothetical protein
MDREFLSDAASMALRIENPVQEEFGVAHDGYNMESSRFTNKSGRQEDRRSPEGETPQITQSRRLKGEDGPYLSRLYAHICPNSMKMR